MGKWFGRMFGAGIAAAAVTTALPAAAQVPGVYGSSISNSSQVLTPAQLASFLGAPDDIYTGIGSGFITYDFGPGFALIDGLGQDFNVYEVDSGSVEFSSVDILVSADNINFFNVEATSLAAIDVIGDDAHGNASFRRSYNVTAAMAALGVTQLRYIKLDGTSGSFGGSSGFDPDSVALVNFAKINTGTVPEPGTWALMILGFGTAGLALRRRSQAVRATA